MTLDISQITLDQIADKVMHGERISSEEAFFLFHHPNILEISALANHRRQQHVPGNTVTYIIGRI